jgi:hypothetical protein
MFRSCGIAVAVWLLLAGAYAYVAWGRIHEPFPVAVIAVLGGTFAAMLLSSFIGLFTGNRDRAAIRRAVNGEPRRDGRQEAASGPIRALDKPLEAPFSGRPCVAYDYDVKRPSQGHSDYAGVAMAPSAIDTPQGSARLLGWVMLDQFAAATMDRLDRARGERYLASATFEPLGITSLLSVLTELIADDDGAIRKDFRIGGGAAGLDDAVITERTLLEGTIVTVIGRWSASRGGFAPAGPTTMNRMFAGDLLATRRQVGGDAVKTFAMALVFFGALHAILVPMYILSSRPRAGGRAGADSVWDERDCDRQKQMLAAGADPNERGTDAMTPLMNAARLDDPACVSNLIAAGARLEATDKYSDTALAHAVAANRDENVKVLRAAGAKDFRVTAATGRKVTDDAPPLQAVRDYIDAVHRGDFETMARLMAHSSVRRMEDRRADLPLWQSLRPRQFGVDEGWMTDDAATIVIRGTTPTGEQRIAYHVERQIAEAGQGGSWQIRKEWFLDQR